MAASCGEERRARRGACTGFARRRTPCANHARRRRAKAAATATIAKSATPFVPSRPGTAQPQPPSDEGAAAAGLQVRSAPQVLPAVQSSVELHVERQAPSFVHLYEPQSFFDPSGVSSVCPSAWHTAADFGAHTPP